MAYDEGLAQRMREALDDRAGLTEKKMFGGLAFMVYGNMACGVTSDGGMMVRVGLDDYESALQEPHTKTFGGAKPKAGWVTVTAEGLSDDEELVSWIDRGIAFALTLPPK